MSFAPITRQRLINHQIAMSGATSAGEVVRHLCAVQAQDYAGGKWSVGLRLPGATDAGIEAAFARKEIVRSWSLRGTLHIMSPEDTRWIVALAGGRMMKTVSAQFRRAEIDRPLLTKSYKAMTAAMQGSYQLSRAEVTDVLNKKGITTEGLRLNFLLLAAALEGHICLGARRGKEFTYTLLDEWLPATPSISREEALNRLAERYFVAHSPAAVRDFAWWAGITLTDAHKAVDGLSPGVIAVKTDGEALLSKTDTRNTEYDANKGVYLLPGFDEYMLGYKDRSVILDAGDLKKVVGSNNGLFSNTIIAGGRVAGTWKRILKKDTVEIDVKLFAPLAATQQKLLMKAIDGYAGYHEVEAVVL